MADFACLLQGGQGFELRAEIPDGPVTLANAKAIIDNFHSRHRQDYGYHFDDGEVELITVRVIGTEQVRPLQLPQVDKANGAGIDHAVLFSRPTTFDDGQTLDTPRYDRGQLGAGHKVPGPAIIIQHNSTTLVPPGYVADVSDYGNMFVHRTA